MQMGEHLDVQKSEARENTVHLIRLMENSLFVEFSDILEQHQPDM